MTKLAHEYTIVRSETVVAEYAIVPAARAETAAPDVLPVPWRRVAVGAAMGVAAGLTVSLLHTGLADAWVLATEIFITCTGLAILGSFFACLSSVPSRR
jgi:hypothetical protein